MIADTTFLTHFLEEGQAGRIGPVREFFANRRREVIRTAIICIADVALILPTSAEAWGYFKAWKIYPLHRGIAEAAGDADRILMRSGQRLGENDNWKAGFCRYYREPVISRDAAFDRLPALRRVAY